MSSPTGRLAALRRPVDAASLGLLRAAFGAVLACEVIRYFAAGWIASYYVDPPFHFTYTGFGWVRPLPSAALHAFFALLFAAAVALALGLFHRVASIVFAAGFAYVFLLDKARYLNHFYLVFLLAVLLAVLPVDRAFALDARRRALPATVPSWALELVRFQIGIVYFYAGIAKLNVDWCLRAEPLLSWLANDSDRPFLGPLYARPETAWVMSWGGLLLDLCAWPLLAWGRTRAAMFAALVAFHLVNAATFGIGIFPWLMIPATTVFFAPDWPRRFALLRSLDARTTAVDPAAAPRKPEPHRLGLAFAAAWVAVQVLVPLRHFLYPGSVHWTEEGHAFSWHMKLRTKQASAIFSVRDPSSGETWVVHPRSELTSWQNEKFAGRPDMILQYAHHLRDRWRARGFAAVEVRVRAEASLNRRPRQLLVDPEVDLAAVEPTILPAHWIVPLQ